MYQHHESPTQISTNTEKLIHPELSYKITGAVFKVYNRLGFGFNEKLYQNALAEEFLCSGLKFTKEDCSRIKYGNKTVGRYFHDFVVENQVVIELKVGDDVYKNHIRQVLTYLKDSGLRLGILFVFTENGVISKRVVK